MGYAEEKTKYQIQQASQGFVKINKRFPTTTELAYFFEHGQHKLAEVFKKKDPWAATNYRKCKAKGCIMVINRHRAVFKDYCSVECYKTMNKLT